MIEPVICDLDNIGVMTFGRFKLRLGYMFINVGIEQIPQDVHPLPVCFDCQNIEIEFRVYQIILSILRKLLKFLCIGLLNFFYCISWYFKKCGAPNCKICNRLAIANTSITAIVCPDWQQVSLTIISSLAAVYTIVSYYKKPQRNVIEQIIPSVLNDIEPDKLRSLKPLLNLKPKSN